MTVITSTRPAPPVLAFDYASVRTIDQDGRLHVGVSNITKESVDPYYGREIPNGAALGLDPNRIYRLYRPGEELERAAPTFNNLPILSKHVPVSARKPSQSLVIGSTGTDSAWVSPYLQNSAVVWVQDDIDDIDARRRKDWSCGYYYTVEMTPGIFNGLRFDGIMRNIIGNHVALVREGRAGPDVMVGDSLPKGLKMLKSRRALILNGALAAYLAPKMAMDAKVDFEPALGNVTAETLGTSVDALATSIVALVTPHLAQDEAVTDADVKGVIAAAQGVTDDAPADTISTPTPPAPTPPVVPPSPAPVVPPVQTPPAPIAMDAAAVGRQLAAMRQAERDVHPFIGEVKIACDSAEGIYELALKHAKVDLTGVDKSAYKAMVGMLPPPAKADPMIALDHVTVASDFAKRFPNAHQLIAS